MSIIQVTGLDLAMTRKNDIESCAHSSFIQRYPDDDIRCTRCHISVVNIIKHYKNLVEQLNADKKELNKSNRKLKRKIRYIILKQSGDLEYVRDGKFLYKEFGKDK